MTTSRCAMRCFTNAPADLPDGVSISQCPACGIGSVPEPLDPQREIAYEFVKAGRRIAEHLRAVAKDVDRHIAHVSTDLSDLHPDYSDSARDVIRDVQRLVGNAEFGDLLRAATVADRTVRAAAQPEN